jgi:hypothetical protein
MPKRTLRNTNPYLKDTDQEKRLIALSVSTSTAIEGIQVLPQEILSWLQPPAPTSARKRRSAL